MLIISMTEFDVKWSSRNSRRILKGIFSACRAIYIESLSNCALLNVENTKSKGDIMFCSDLINRYRHLTLFGRKKLNYVSGNNIFHNND